MDAHVVIYYDNISSMYYLLSIWSFMLGQNTLKCTITLLEKKKLIKEINFIRVNKDQIVDIFTKALSTHNLRKFRKMFGVLEVDLSLRGSVENSNSTSQVFISYQSKKITKGYFHKVELLFLFRLVRLFLVWTFN